MRVWIEILRMPQVVYCLRPLHSAPSGLSKRNPKIVQAGLSRRWGKRLPLELPITQKAKETNPSSPLVCNLAWVPLGLGKSPLRTPPRPPHPVPRPPRTPGGADLCRAGSRAGLGSGLGMLGSPGGSRWQVGSVRTRETAARAAVAAGAQARAGTAKEGCSPLAPVESAIRVEIPDTALPRISFRGGGLGERNSGGCCDSVQGEGSMNDPCMCLWA
ncbi:uncharacterized protein V5649_017184 [Rhynchonycteris naso]